MTSVKNSLTLYLLILSTFFTSYSQAFGQSPTPHWNKATAAYNGVLSDYNSKYGNKTYAHLSTATIELDFNNYLTRLDEAKRQYKKSNDYREHGEDYENMHRIQSNIDAVENMQNSLREFLENIKDERSLENQEKEHAEEVEKIVNQPYADGEIGKYYQYGILSSMGAKIDGREEGEWTYYHDNGNVHQIGSYRYGIEYGIWKIYHYNGELKEYGNTHGGEKVGEWTVNDESGNLSYKFNPQTKIYKYYYDSGQLKAIGSKDYYNNREGEWKYYHENGNLKEIANFDNGNLQGINELYYINGKVKLRREFNASIVIANWDQYLSDGTQVLKEGNGKLYSYLEDGTLFVISEYANGKRDGITTWFYTNGKEEQSILYEPTDELLSDVIGYRMEVLSSFNSDGSSREKGTLKNGNGTIILYDANGVRTGISTFKDGNEI